MTQAEFGDWWRDELGRDPTYDQVITPLLVEVLDPQPDLLYLDVGSGEGRVMRSLADGGARVAGVEISEPLATSAGPATSVAEARALPVGDSSVDGAYLVLVLEHLDDHVAVFVEVARVVTPGGVMAVVMNHPVWTAPGSTPITDDDGELLWRPGEYFSEGISRHPIGEGSVVFHHRSMAPLLNAAASVGWSLERLEERPHHDMAGQEGIPRLLACRWRLLP